MAEPAYFDPERADRQKNYENSQGVSPSLHGSPSRSATDVEYLAGEIRRLARNIWWTWHPRAQDFFRMLAPQTWRHSCHNAVAVLNALSEQELRALLSCPQVEPIARTLIDEFENYLNDKNTWTSFHAPEFMRAPVAYFSAEFGLHESLPIYSGGLGILAGDHAKSASDLGLPLVAVGLFYRNGYFHQQIDENGWQQEIYPTLDPANLPIEPVLDKDGHPVTVTIFIAHTEVVVGAWRVNIGRNPLYLLDTNFPENEAHWRDLTSRVYGGDAVTRVGQEMVLGVGGSRLLKKLGIHPAVFHLNEGHPGFLILDLLKDQIEAGLALEAAQEKVREMVVFTTHTPVAAGHDRFSTDMINHMMSRWPGQLKLTLDEFMQLGRVNPQDANEQFCMTVLALRHSRAANAVSELNARISRQMWSELSARKENHIPPIGHITNGVHVLGWMNRITYEFWEHTLGEHWLKHLKQDDFWEKVGDEKYLADASIWGLRYRLKRQLIEVVRDRTSHWNRRSRRESGPVEDSGLNPDALTIGFSRRFATYKRATLLFRDLDRAAKIFNDPDRPVQLIVAGKAHPRDDAAKALLQQIFHLARDRLFLGKIFIVENYDIELARHIISGVDLLLNNPRRPLEACGTSGQKIAVHGGLNLGVMDGWWREGYDGHNGFAIGKDESLDDPDAQEEIDARELYNVLERQAIPEYYDRLPNGLPHRWIQRIRRAMATLIPKYTTDRMVAEYTERYYKHRS